MSAITAKASRKMKKYAVLTREPRCFLGSFDFSWEQRKVGDLLIERNQQAPMSDEYPLMAFIANEGVAPKGERYDRSALVTDTVNKLYKKTEKGDFIYSSNNLETGSIGLNKYGKACISPVYSIFEPTGIADSDFLGRRLVRKDFINAMVKWRQGVIYGQWRIHESDFLKIEIPVPSVEEQRKIGAYLDQLDNLITLHQRKCALLFSPFQALISMMFTTSTFSWEQRKLGEIGSVSMCRRIFKEQTSETGDIPFYKIGTFGAEPDAFISRELFEEYKSKYPYPKKGDILISASGSIGRTVEFAGNNEYFQDSNIVWISHDERLSNSFLKCFYSVVKWAGIEGSTIKRLYNDNILNTVICMPSVPEQEHIGLFFENLDNIITLHQRKCISFTGRAGRLISTVNKKRITSSWEQRKLSELTSMHARIGWQNLRTSEFLDSGNYMLITGTDFNDGAINFSTCHYVERERYEQDRNIQIHNGSILITKDGTLGKVAYVQGLSMPATLNAGVFNVQIKDANNVDEKYLFQYLKAPFLMDYVDKKATGGTIKHLNQSILVDFPVILPQRSEQTLIGAFFQQLDNLITLHQRKPFLMKWRNSDANRNQTNRLVL